MLYRLQACVLDTDIDFAENFFYSFNEGTYRNDGQRHNNDNSTRPTNVDVGTLLIDNHSPMSVRWWLICVIIAFLTGAGLATGITYFVTRKGESISSIYKKKKKINRGVLYYDQQKPFITSFPNADIHCPRIIDGEEGCTLANVPHVQYMCDTHVVYVWCTW